MNAREFELKMRESYQERLIHYKTIKDDQIFVMVVRQLYNYSLLSGVVGDVTDGYTDRWCFSERMAASLAFLTYKGEEEPTGWIRHLPSNRLRPDGDPSQEYVGGLE